VDVMNRPPIPYSKLTSTGHEKIATAAAQSLTPLVFRGSGNSKKQQLSMISQSPIVPIVPHFDSNAMLKQQQPFDQVPMSHEQENFGRISRQYFGIERSHPPDAVPRMYVKKGG
jgi:hypothetical protein